MWSLLLTERYRDSNGKKSCEFLKYNGAEKFVNDACHDSEAVSTNYYDQTHSCSSVGVRRLAISDVGDISLGWVVLLRLPLHSPDPCLSSQLSADPHCYHRTLVSNAESTQRPLELQRDSIPFRQRASLASYLSTIFQSAPWIIRWRLERFCVCI